MHITALSVDEALRKGLQMLRAHGVYAPSRNGRVLRMNSPVITEYALRRRYILTNAARNANPFFHFMESLWMLAGRNDLAFVSFFNKRMATYTDDGVTQPAAYGHRWRNHFGVDQIMFVVNELQNKPDSRRAVITMADPSVDIAAAQRNGADVPCNTGIYFSLIAGQLNMTVVCRSNDAIWGAYGANAVHMSVLQEYVAAWLGVPVGTYYQISNDFHVYVDLFGDEKIKAMIYEPIPAPEDSPAAPKLLPVGWTMEQFDNDLREFFFAYDNGQAPELRTPYFRAIAMPMLGAWRAYKSGDRDEARVQARSILNAAWRYACTDWLYRAWQNKDNGNEKH